MDEAEGRSRRRGEMREREGRSTRGEGRAVVRASDKGEARPFLLAEAGAGVSIKDETRAVVRKAGGR